MGSTLLRKVDTFLRGITRSDTVALLHDKDPDGICSGVLLHHALKRLRGRGVDVRINAPHDSYSLTPQLVARLRRRKIDVLIVADISADHEPKLIRQVSRFARVLIIDHHKFYGGFKQRNILLVKPQLMGSKVDPSRYCTSKLAYDLCSRLVDMRDLVWLAAVGSIADIATAPWKTWLRGVMRRHNVKSNGDLFKTAFGKVAITINSSLLHSERNVAVVFKTVAAAKKPGDVIGSPLRRYRAAIEAEIQKWIRRVPAIAERHDDMMIVAIKPKYRIGSTLSTLLSFKYPDKSVIMVRRNKGMVSLSGRRQDRAVPMNALFECAIEGLSGATAGGHVPAAGGRLRAKDFTRFKRQLIACHHRLRS